MIYSIYTVALLAAAVTTHCSSLMHDFVNVNELVVVGNVLKNGLLFVGLFLIFVILPLQMSDYVQDVALC